MSVDKEAKQRRGDEEEEGEEVEEREVEGGVREKWKVVLLYSVHCPCPFPLMLIAAVTRELCTFPYLSPPRITFCIEFLPSKVRGIGVLLVEVQ